MKENDALLEEIGRTMARNNLSYIIFTADPSDHSCNVDVSMYEGQVAGAVEHILSVVQDNVTEKQFSEIMSSLKKNVDEYFEEVKE